MQNKSKKAAKKLYGQNWRCRSASAGPAQPELYSSLISQNHSNIVSSI